MPQPGYVFTVFTPTYNRAHTLPRVYDCLRRQTFRDFEWLIVDDGSSDGTPGLVAGWRAQAPFPVRYVRQGHGHKKAAFNRGVREARGELFVALDSDDAMPDDALAIMHRVWQGIPAGERERYSAVTGLCARPDGGIVGDRYPRDVFDASPLEMTYRWRVRGEKFGFQRTDVLRRFPYPEDVQGFVPESLVWSAISRAGYLTRFVNEVLRIYHDSGDSLSRQGAGDAGVHAAGLYLLARDALLNGLPWLRRRPGAVLMAAARYTRFGLHLRAGGVRLPAELSGLAGAGVLAHALVVLAWPLGVAMYLRDRLRARRGRRAAPPGASQPPPAPPARPLQH